MANDSGEPSVPHLIIPRAELAGRLDERISLGQELYDRPITTDEDFISYEHDLRSWEEYNRELLRRSFSSSQLIQEYNREFRPGPWDHPPLESSDLDRRASIYRTITAEQVRRLKSLRNRLELYPEGIALPQPQPVPSTSSTTDANIFLVHGRSEAPKEAVARFLGQITDLKPIILREEANAGRTVIEKFEDFASNTAFAVIILTGDDRGGLLSSREQQRRARQNVVFELGFFVGRLSRARVAVLYEEGVELPSDVSGILYTSLDPSGAWKMELAREMRSAGLDIDLNRII